MSEEFRVGRHVVRYEPPDIIVIRFIGDITGPDLREIGIGCKPWEAGNEYILLLIDLSEVGSILPAARRPTEERAERAMHGTAFFGTSPRTRILVNLAMRALNVLL